MPTIAEVELMNRGFDRLGDSLLKSRMLDEQKRERELARGERAQAFGLEERRVTAAERSATANEDMKALLLKDRQTQQAIEQVRTQVNDITARHRNGQISTEQANAQIRRIQTGIKAGTDLVLQESGLADFSLQDIPKDEKGHTETAPERNLAKRLELEQAVAQAQTPEEKIRAERALALWKEERGGAGDTERVTEFDYDTNPESPTFGMQKVSRSRTVRGGTDASPRPSISPVDKQPAEALPLPANKGELVKGRKYQTARGVAMWNGQAFVK